MPKQSSYSKLLLLAILLTAMTIAVQPLLPKKTLMLTPEHNESADAFLLPFNEDPDGKKVYWVNKEKTYHYHCKFEPNEKNLPCVLIIKLTEDGVNGTDLTDYDTIEFAIKYNGNANGLRLSMRNFDPRFSKVKDDNSGKYHWLYLRKAELEENMKIPLSEFAVADWWRSSYNLSREQTHADLSNVTVLSFDFVDDISGGLQDIDIGNIQIVGDWVSKERWYLSIIVAWASFGTLFALWRLAYLTKKEQLQNDKIHDLLVKNSHLEIESSKFRKLSTVDALTNIFNRYGIEQIIIALETKRQSCAVIIFDIDNFKLVNDKRGHDCGDRVLQRVCEIIAANTRTVDIFGVSV